jgi:hypothetical protein
MLKDAKSKLYNATLLVILKAGNRDGLDRALKT